MKEFFPRIIKKAKPPSPAIGKRGLLIKSVHNINRTSAHSRSLGDGEGHRSWGTCDMRS